MFPIRDTIRSERRPVVTWTLIAANVAVFAYQLSLPEARLEEFFYLYGIVPRRFSHPAWAAYVGFPRGIVLWPFFTSMFLHGGWLHIVSNMWTLWIFGDNVEDRMGRLRFLAFYLLCGTLSGVTHFFSNLNSPVPTIGASGAIAGVLGAYFILFPLARIVTVVPIFFFPVVVEIYAFFYLIFWFFSQFFVGTMSLLAQGQGGGGIAWWAHVGGFLAGAFLHKKFLKRRYRIRWV